jgi:hypothetical protein
VAGDPSSISSHAPPRGQYNAAAFAPQPVCPMAEISYLRKR